MKLKNVSQNKYPENDIRGRNFAPDIHIPKTKVFSSKLKNNNDNNDANNK